MKKLPRSTPPKLKKASSADKAAADQALHCRRWRHERLQHLRQHPMYEVCGGVADEVHHVVDRIDDLSRVYDTTNYQSICGSCHSKETNRRLKGEPRP
jgi:5-methylcytosine-specific restriction protein A